MSGKNGSGDNTNDGGTMSFGENTNIVGNTEIDIWAFPGLDRTMYYKLRPNPWTVSGAF